MAVASGGSWVPMDSGGIWVSTNSGGTWTQTSAPGAGWVLVTSSADGNKLVAFGTLRSFYTSTNAGATWISNNVPVVGGKWDSLVSSADGCKLAVMSQQSVELGPLLLTSTNSGATWKTNNLPAGGPWKPVGWNQINRSRPGDLPFNQFRRNLDIYKFTAIGSSSHCLLGGRRQISGHLWAIDFYLHQFGDDLGADWRAAYELDLHGVFSRWLQIGGSGSNGRKL